MTRAEEKVDTQSTDAQSTDAQSTDAQSTDAPTTGDDGRTQHRPDSAAERLGADTVEPRADTEEPGPETLIPADRSTDYRGRWGEIKGEFVDDPRSAVQAANTLVGEVLDELEELFRRQRADLEQGLADERTSTEDLRLALRRYHSFFDRLLSF